MHISLLIPVCDQQETIAEDLWRLAQQAEAVSPDWELVVVDRGSRDRTPEILERTRSREPRLILVCHARRRGLGEAWRSALLRARGEVLVLMDRAGEWDLSGLAAMTGRLEGFDLVAGYRRQCCRGIQGWFRARWLRWMMNLDPHLLSGGILVFKRQLFSEFGMQEPQDGAFWELVARVAAGGKKMDLVPVPFFKRSTGQGLADPDWKTLLRVTRLARYPASPLFSVVHETQTARLRLDFLQNSARNGEGDLALER